MIYFSSAIPLLSYWTYSIPEFPCDKPRVLLSYGKLLIFSYSTKSS
jgi:hypothetical protein